MNRTLFAVFVVVSLLVGFQIGFSVPPFLQAGVFSERKEKGVESRIDSKMKQYYDDLYQSDQ
jgi:hypothetical protein